MRKHFFLIGFLAIFPMLVSAQAAGEYVKRPVIQHAKNNIKPEAKPQKSGLFLHADPMYQGKKGNTLQPILIFGIGKSNIDAAGFASIEMVARFMKIHPDAKIVVEGYTSLGGSTEKNQRLSEARAVATKQALVKRYDIDANRIIANGMGETDKLSEEPDFNNIVKFVLQE